SPGNATLGEVIAHLVALPSTQTVERGFTHPHSYRGYYEDLAFEPCCEVTVAHMLETARKALDQTFEGYKGGDYVMTEDTPCWLAEYGSTGLPIVLLGTTHVYVLPTPHEGP